MDSILDSIINFLPIPTVFEMSFGLIISMVLFLIDRGGKVRQEEALRRQDESLDIILDQVSKVNLFQTRTLSLAIESLGRDFDNFRKDLDLIKSSIQQPEVKISSSEKKDSVNEIPTPPSGQLPSLSTHFGDVLSTQVNSFLGQIKSNISELAKTEASKNKDLYKVKKGLEFDLKDLFNIQTMLDEMKGSHKPHHNWVLPSRPDVPEGL